jgi:hypothetical protein
MRRPILALAAIAALALAVRFAFIFALPDADTDAYGHFGIARALLREPWNLSVHWVWLPGYHYLLWALLHLGVGFRGARIFNTLLQAGAPFLLYDFVARRGGGDPPERSARVALLAAIAWAVAPLPNLLAISAQAETSFTLLCLASAWALERRRPALAGSLLAAACLFRYEAWGAVAALALHRLARKSVPLPAIAIPLSAVASWILLMRSHDGEWLSFFRKTHEFASTVREGASSSPVVDALWFPGILPAVVLGPALLLVPLGLRRALRLGWLVPGGILAFLWLSYAGRGALGLDRYYTALVPFACVAVAEGALRVPELWPRISARAAAAAALCALALMTVTHLRWMVRHTLPRQAELRGSEAALSDR